MTTFITGMGLAQWLVLFVALQRIAELAWSRRNEARLFSRGGMEVGARHYPLIVALHTAWLVALFIGIPPGATVYWSPLAAFAVLQGLRVWVIASLGPYWTTRVVTLPEAPIVHNGPYRWMRHPNYAIVVAEIAMLPLAFGAWRMAVIFSLLNGAILAWRIRIENRALATRRHRANSD